jgi:hypothetical protein
MLVRSKFRGSPLQSFFPNCPRTIFYCAGGMLTALEYARVRVGNSISSRATEINFLTPMNTGERG